MGTLQWVAKRKLQGEMKKWRKAGLFFTTQQLFARLKQNEQFFFFKREQQGRSSKEERKVNALALRAEEGRDYLR